MNHTPDATLMGRRTKDVAVQASRRIALVGPTGASLRHLRGPLIGALLAARHKVTCLAKSIAPEDEAALRGYGAETEVLAQPHGLALLSEWREVSALAAALEAYRPGIVMAYGADTLLPAVKAARSAKVDRIVGLINELPDETRDQKALKSIGRALELVDAAVFHNHDQIKVLKANGLLPRDLTYIVVPGTGVDLDAFPAEPLPDLAGGLVFLMAARLDRQKGVLDYVEAAEAVKARRPSARFLLAGPEQKVPGGLTAAMIEPLRDSVEYLGAEAGMREALKRCHVFVYPSHGEGMPRPVLEALAAGRPVITSDTAGCRETVDERVNGVLVKPGDVAGLVTAIESFLKRADLIPAMARAARSKAERKFSRRDVNAALFQVLGV